MPVSPAFATETAAADWLRADYLLTSMSTGDIGLMLDGKTFTWTEPGQDR